jgi:hypothetical protein
MISDNKGNIKLLLGALVNLVEQKLGFAVASISDCHKASEVLSQHRIALSGHTIARLFGILNSKSKPYKSTLNLVAQFCGFRDFDQYVFSMGLFSKGDLDEIQTLVNRNNAKLEIALRFAFQAQDAASIHAILEQIEDDPYSIWLSNTGSYLYTLPPDKQLRLLEILSGSAAGVRYFFEQYINENDLHGSYSRGLSKFYRSSISINKEALFPQLFNFSQYVYRGKRVNHLKLNDKDLKKCSEAFDLNFHLRSRILEIEILVTNFNIGKKSKINTLNSFAERAMREVSNLNTVEKTWFYSRICRAAAHKGLILVLLENSAFRSELHKLYDMQKDIIYYPAVLMLQIVLHYFWTYNGIEHEYTFSLHHPYCAQNESNAIKSMEAFGLALYDQTIIGNSIRRNLPITLKQNGQLWMKGLLPAIKLQA